MNSLSIMNESQGKDEMISINENSKVDMAESSISVEEKKQAVTHSNNVSLPILNVLRHQKDPNNLSHEYQIGLNARHMIQSVDF